jgi:hypothetical protein
MILAECMKDRGLRTLEMAMAMRSMTIRTFTSATFRKGKLTEKDFTHGPMESTTKEIGRKARSKALESGREMVESLILEIGSRGKLTALVLTYGRMETTMKEAGTSA